MKNEAEDDSVDPLEVLEAKAVRYLLPMYTKKKHYTFLSKLEWSMFTISQLKKMLRSCTLPLVGRKTDLIKRITVYVEGTKRNSCLDMEVPSKMPLKNQHTATGLMSSADNSATNNGSSSLAPPALLASTASTLPASPANRAMPVSRAEVAKPPVPTAQPVNKSALYTELVEAGFSDQQVLDGIAACGGLFSARFDAVMLWIINSIEAESSPKPCEAYDEELEDEEMQAVILLSEGERDVIESRKRRREEDLTNDCQNSVYDAEEFRNSYLLYGLPQELSSEVKTIRKHTTHVFRKNTEHVHSNNNLQHQQHLSSMNSSSRGKCKDCPCAGLDTMMILIDRNSRRCLKKLMASEGGGAPKCTCPTDIIALKASVAALLFLEAKALGWYRANCAAYLYFLAQRLTAAVAAHPIELTIHQLADSSSSSAMRGANNSYGHVNKLVNIINDEVSKLQAVLFSIPEMDLGIPGPPKAFSECFKLPGLPRNVLSSRPDLEEDGFEIIE